MCRLSSFAVVLGLVAYLGLLPAATFAAGTTETYAYTTQVGSIDYDQVTDIATDSSGNVYMVGEFGDQTDFDPTGGTDNRTPVGAYDIFITKVLANGSYGWTRTIGGSGNEFTSAVTVDGNGDVYYSGFFSDASMDFDPTGGTDTLNNLGNLDSFVTKLTSAGAYGWTRLVSGSDVEFIRDVKATSGGLYLTGSYTTNNINFNLAGSDVHANSGTEDGYLTKYSLTGTYAWTKSFGGQSDDGGRALNADSGGNVYLGGYASEDGTAGINFNRAGSDVQASTGFKDAVVMKFAPAGTYGWTRLFGGPDGYEVVEAVAVRSDDTIFTGGTFEGNDVDLDPSGSIDLVDTTGDADLFITSLDTAGAYLNGKSFGGTAYENIEDMVFDNTDNLYVVGEFASESIDFDPSSGSDTKNNFNTSGNYDGFIAKYAQDESYDYAKVIGGADSEYIYGLAVATGAVYLGGAAQSSPIDFNPDSGTDSKNNLGAGQNDGFLQKWTQTSAYSTSKATNVASGLDVVTVSGNIDVESTGVTPASSVAMYAKTSSGTILAEITANMTRDRSWANVTFGSDATNGKAFIHNVNTLIGVSSSYKLYVPKLEGSTGVTVCPGASSLGSLTSGCGSATVLPEGHGSLTSTTIGGTNYWVVSGVTGTGALNNGGTAGTSGGNSSSSSNPSSNAETLADTGHSINTLLGLATTLIVSGLGVLFSSRRHTSSSDH